MMGLLFPQKANFCTKGRVYIGQACPDDSQQNMLVLVVDMFKSTLELLEI
jgi:hypothetical protein